MVVIIFNRCISSLKLWVQILITARCTRYLMWKSLFVTNTCGRSVVFSRPSINKTDHHDITEILLKVALNTTILTLFIYKNYICNSEYTIQSNLYIEATQGNLKMWPLWAVALNIQVKIICSIHDHEWGKWGCPL